MNCTQVVQTIGDQLAGTLDKAFGSERVRVAVVREQKDAPWWTEECGLARLAMLDYKARTRAESRMDDGVAKAEFSRLRTRYQRMRREAKERYRIDHFEGLMQECRADPRALWKMLNAGANETCPITEVSSWSDYFNAL